MIDSQPRELLNFSLILAIESQKSFYTFDGKSQSKRNQLRNYTYEIALPRVTPHYTHILAANNNFYNLDKLV